MFEWWNKEKCFSLLVWYLLWTEFWISCRLCCHQIWIRTRFKFHFHVTKFCTNQLRNMCTCAGCWLMSGHIFVTNITSELSNIFKTRKKKSLNFIVFVYTFKLIPCYMGRAQQMYIVQFRRNNYYYYCYIKNNSEPFRSVDSPMSTNWKMNSF